MSTDVVMPQMGESIAEGTIVRWLRKVGDEIDRDEPLFEISTDKVDAEIPSPAAGILIAIKVQEGETVPINSVVAVIGESDDVASAAPPAEAAPATPAPPAAPAPPAPSSLAAADPSAAGAVERVRSSPLVRRLAREHGVDLSQVTGSGSGGRVTKQDILAHIDRRPAKVSPAPPGTDAPRPRVAPVASVDAAPGVSAEGTAPTFEAGQSSVAVPMTVMRQRIAEHMVASRRTSAHVHSIFEVDFSRVQQLRKAHGARYDRSGAKLTLMPFIAKAVIDALRAMPIVNTSVDGDRVVYKRDINLGVAVALESGLIVPVVKNADEKNLLGLSRAIADLAGRARARQLVPADVQDGTFTITNPGGLGAVFGLPIINQPQVAILGVGSLEKRPVVVNDAIAIRSIAYLTLGFDHRLIDGVVADQFMGHVKRGLEQFEESIV
ncbi:MAG: dihydrolipoamide acetyltransferase family protein [Vicinamibacterales bacterium]|jgi:2-oxoglutarate dehydrogenase E2 component (dihydrolipoamide succinyltransferase)|nr:dihydrolipoyllysine succinyltransferase [Acidobacteriota bacterium]MDP6372668.1 dihydrolipoamide acetyltransferase family protein [Vicinamibacterales bacterium]MDP6607928.1 dihydrolipoamide acetyltransferase family protein [Vicinamibacterales bacterium]HAK54059.1 2-oxoglutarate dehydrogenase, E2 component, dihydrolipoamide succinyltransferase [Acidobacteriota bacterium]|tara:strand:+ start:357 stop:1667 length:1311 start_codon:yes stop_codon:yes gene_type:complete